MWYVVGRKRCDKSDNNKKPKGARIHLNFVAAMLSPRSVTALTKLLGQIYQIGIMPLVTPNTATVVRHVAVLKNKMSKSFLLWNEVKELALE